MTITIINYGMGNTGSIRNMLTKIGIKSAVSSDYEAIAAADKLILPGVGAFDPAMKRLQDLNVISLLNDRVINDLVPFLGVCLGMQLITTGSDEGELPGLGWVDARARSFASSGLNDSLPVPHMGWNSVNDIGPSLLLDGMTSDARFYFAHSYYVDCDDSADVQGTSQYGVEFASVIGRQNIFGVQFHPEKSHRFGMAVLRGFVERC